VQGGNTFRHSKWAAAAVHVFTASGIVAALFATRAMLAGRYEEVFMWLGLALFIDGIDGTFARITKVWERLPRFSGEQLDLVIDYVTYVFIPALLLLQAGYLTGWSGWFLASLILLSSLFHFSDTESKTEDKCFVGFPAVWNIVAFYVFALELSVVGTAMLVLACVALTFVPLKWVHPMRVVAAWPATALATLGFTVASFAIVLQGFPAAPWAKVVLVLVALYVLGLSAWFGRARPTT
jgi:phosphatidylcholine synthase